MNKTLVLFACLAGPLAAQEIPVNVEARSMTVRFQDVNEQWNKQPKGIVIETLLSYKGENGVISPLKGFDVKLDLKASDSTGKSLGKVTQGMVMPNRDDETTMAYPLKIATLPQPDSTYISLEGSISVILSTGKTTTPAQPLPLKAGAELKFGDMVVKVEEASPSTLELSMDYLSNDPPFVFIFTDKKGKEIKLDKGGSMSSTMGGKVSASQTYRLNTKVDDINIAIQTWEKSEQVNVPVKMKIGIGGEVK